MPGGDDRNPGTKQAVENSVWMKERFSRCNREMVLGKNNLKETLLFGRRRRSPLSQVSVLWKAARAHNEWPTALASEVDDRIC